MNSVAQFLVDQWDGLRLGSASQWVWRLSLAVLLGASVVTSWWWAQSTFVPVLLGTALLLAAVAIWNPDSLAVGGFITTTVGWWLLSGRPENWWQPAIASALLFALHLVAAGSAAGPFVARWSPAAIRSWAGSAGLVFVLAMAAVAVTLAVARIPAEMVPRGPLWIFAAVVTVLGAAVWAAGRGRS